MQTGPLLRSCPGRFWVLLMRVRADRAHRTSLPPASVATVGPEHHEEGEREAGEAEHLPVAHAGVLIEAGRPVLLQSRLLRGLGFVWAARVQQLLWHTSSQVW